MLEVDVFEHHRFCDEFSHLVKRRFVATLTLWWSLNSIEYKFKMFERFLEIFKYNLYLWIINFLTVTSVGIRCFWASRFYDEFSHLVKRRFVATLTLWWSLNSIEYKFKMFERLLGIFKYNLYLWIIILFNVTSVGSRCFWASQILWWILTSS